MSGVVFIGFVWLFTGTVGMLWVFIDASENSSQSAVLWGLVVFFGGILGILLYILLGRDGGSEQPRTRSDPARGTGKISHRCQSCGEKYYAPNSEIGSCRSCGGIKVERLG